MGPPWLAVWVASTSSSALSQHPGAQTEPAQQPHEGHQIAARAGAAGEVELAGLDLVPVRGNGEFHRAHSDGLHPHQLTLPQRARVEIVGEFDGLHVLRRQRRREEQQESGQALQNCLPFRMR
jgi:hypothetical protein